MLRVLAYFQPIFHRYVNDKWTDRLLRHLPSIVTNFSTQVKYHGIKLYVNTGENAGRRLFYYGVYEVEQEQVFLEMVPNRKVFDIGANIGIFTLLAASRGAEVFAFEPSRMVRIQLKRNIDLNRLEERITIVPEAVADTQGTTCFFETRNDNWGVGRIFLYGHTPDESVHYTVPTKTLDQFVAELGMPDVVKMDIEGAEWLVLRGASCTLADHNAPDFLIEFHPGEIQALGGSIETCISQLRAFGFKQYQLSKAPMGSSHKWYVFSKRTPFSFNLGSIREVA